MKTIFLIFVLFFLPFTVSAQTPAPPTEQTFFKRPSEKYGRAFEYRNRLPFKSNLVSGVGSAYNITDSVDATAAVLQSTILLINGTQARVGLKDGAVGKTYRITFRVTLSDTSILEDSFLLTIY